MKNEIKIPDCPENGTREEVIAWYDELHRITNEIMIKANAKEKAAKQTISSKGKNGSKKMG